MSKTCSWTSSNTGSGGFLAASLLPILGAEALGLAIFAYLRSSSAAIASILVRNACSSSGLMSYVKGFGSGPPASEIAGTISAAVWATVFGGFLAGGGVRGSSLLDLALGGMPL